MHVGKCNKESKTKAVFFPSRTKIQNLISYNEKSLLSDINLPLDDIKEKHKTSLKNMKVVTDRFFVKAKESQQLILKDSSFISVTRNSSTLVHGYRMI